MRYMVIIAVLVALVQLTVTLDSESSGGKVLDPDNDVVVDLEPCEECELDKCPPVTKCNVGLARDRCGCCDVCGLEEGHLCNVDPYQSGKVWFGNCGTDLECRVRNDVDRILVGNQSICYCVTEGFVCASNKQTLSYCQMQALAVKSEGNVSMISRGPCKTGPRIISGEKVSESVIRGTSVSFLCEVEGYPMPNVVWYYKKPGSEDNYNLPGDSDEISVSFRGGPQPMRISSHLQITNFQDKHEGEYKCLADNDMGMGVADFSLVARDPKEGEVFKRV